MLAQKDSEILKLNDKLAAAQAELQSKRAQSRGGQSEPDSQKSRVGPEITP